jgi:hypothetical protein
MKLSKQEVRKRAEISLRDKKFAFRTCWNCNSAHEHLKRVKYLFCCMFGCGNWFYLGRNLTDLTDEESNNRSEKKQVKKRTP